MAVGSFKEKLEKVLKYESQLLSVFRKYLPYEKGFVLQKSEDWQVELQLGVGSEEIEAIKQFYSEFDNWTNIQKANFLKYLAFLFAIYQYEKELKRLEYEEKDSKLSQLKDERLLNIARALKKESRRGRKPKKRRKLEKLKGEILRLRKEGLGADMLSKYLWKTHRLKVTKQYLLKVLKEWEKGEVAG
ncbi:hypothetical protein GFV12_08505 (plasmid) [Desulfurobacterium thermolithotrophum]|uniref:hypothetical protein n=1 Tax=Desulfurobacterium thermolithotrophum TaxID=64160 RepID=UPI0013D49CB2|nr:hypothetical protein [Desulfurobacterium thermolithotrophum]